MTTFGVNGSEGSKGSLIYKMASENLKAKGITKPTTEQIRAAMKEAANSVGITLDNETLDKIINSELEVKGLYVERNPKQETFVDFNDGAMKPKAGQNTLDKDFDKIVEEIRQNPEKFISVNRLTEKQLQEILDLIKKLKPDPQGTTKAMGEEGGSTVTTAALNEEGGSGIRPIDITYALGENGGSVTTEALNEEGGGDNMTTKAMGEEGGSTVTTEALNEEGGSGIRPIDITYALGENGGSVTTEALNEEGGGDNMTTKAMGEEGGGFQLSEELLQKLKDQIRKDNT